jgi:Phospholipase_D-nuclease N-terminal
MGIHHHFGPVGPYVWPLVVARLALFALFILVPWIIALAYVWRDARRRGQPGWLWALVGIFLSWLGILAYLVVRAFAPVVIPATPSAGTWAGPRASNAPPAPMIDAPPAE